MSVRQSLGKVAVVPKGSWDGTKTYEFLDIVKYGGGSYIARKDVPIGTAITNTEYWVSLVDKGEIGDDGVSPSVTVTPITGGHRVTITDAAHPQGQSFDVMDGEDTGVEVDPTLTIAGAAADAAAVGNLKSDLNSVFNYGERSATLSALADGYISKTGTIEGTGASTRHASLEITSDYVGKNLKVTGSNWYSMKPYVFVGDNSTIVYADCPSASLSVYTDLPFKPTTTGTLYVNHHTDSATYGVKIHEIDTLKDTALPDDLANALEYVSGYKEMTFATETGHYLNASNGNITDVDSTNAVITEFIPIVGGNPYLITTEHFWGQGMYVFYDVNKSYISGVASANSGTITKVINQKVTAPQNASYLVVAMWAQTNFPDITVCECVFSSISPSLKWNGKKWTCVGDSLTEQNIKAVRHYYDYVSEATGIAPVILGVGGTGYARGQENNNAFYQRVSAVPSDSDVITIFGSFNDLGSNLPIGNVDDVNTTTIAGCINTTINNILTINPIANIGIVAPCPWSTTQPTESGGEYQYVSMIEAICKRRSIPYLDLWHYSGMRPWDSAFSNLAYPPNDTVHPNDVGHSILAPKFKAFLESLLM